MVETIDISTALCRKCRYPLRGLETHRCPECGRWFNPNDPKTMIVNGEVSRVSRWWISQNGTPTLVWAISAVLMTLVLGVVTSSNPYVRPPWFCLVLLIAFNIRLRVRQRMAKLFPNLVLIVSQEDFAIRVVL
jgi:hypothetical protein